MEDTLLKNLTERYVTSMPDPIQNDFMNDIVIYDLCGYLLKVRPSITTCLDCKKNYYVRGAGLTRRF